MNMLPCIQKVKHDAHKQFDQRVYVFTYCFHRYTWIPLSNHFQWDAVLTSAKTTIFLIYILEYFSMFHCSEFHHKLKDSKSTTLCKKTMEDMSCFDMSWYLLLSFIFVNEYWRGNNINMNLNSRWRVFFRPYRTCPSILGCMYQVYVHPCAS
jgi:hypothetical protein